MGSKFFPFRVDEFAEGSKPAVKQIGKQQNNLPSRKFQKFRKILSNVAATKSVHSNVYFFTMALWKNRIKFEYRFRPDNQNHI